MLITAGLEAAQKALRPQKALRLLKRHEAVQVA
jgi:hypothetical protein